METKSIIYEKKEGVARIILNRPDQLNAINLELLQEIEKAFEDIESDQTVKAVLISAKGRAFCAGADLKFMKGLLDSPAKTEAFLRFLRKTFNDIEGCSKPVVTAVHGMALAGGLELIMVSDLAIASEDARIGDQHANFGLIPGGGATQRLPRIVGLRKAKEIILTGEWLSAREAEKLGLINKVVPADQLEKEALAVVAKVIENKSPLAAKGIKALTNATRELGLQTGLEMELQVWLSYFRSEDFAEGLKAFEERRTPAFKGR